MMLGRSPASGAYALRRRKLRKGTHSCWACKKRKEKCVFSAQGESSCVSCQRRGIQCISQNFPDEHPVLTTPIAYAQQLDERVKKIETLLGELSHRQQSCSSDPSPFLPIDGFKFWGPNTEKHALSSTSPDSLLSQTLYESLPSQQDIDAIFGASTYFQDKLNTFLFLSNASHDEPGDFFRIVPPMPASDAHPVLIARVLLQLAGILQLLPRGRLPTLSTPAQSMGSRLADSAIRLVTTQDGLLASVEGIQCTMLESLYHCNAGAFRLSWTVNRRAISLAQMLGFHHYGSSVQAPVLDPASEPDHKILWFRMNCYDRHLCLILGLPPITSDLSMASAENLLHDTPLVRLERRHCAIASHLLERNETDPYNFEVTQTLDKELREAANDVPSKYWLPPDLVTSNQDDQTLFREVRCMLVQILHYNILNQLHIPYMLLSSSNAKYEYSKVTCVMASREILLRFITLRRVDRTACCCRLTDFIALMAAMTLVLAHLDSHHRPSIADGLLSHLYLSDRAMMQEARENMQQVSFLNEDAISAESAKLLHRLLDIEAEAARAEKGQPDGTNFRTPDSAQQQEDAIHKARIRIPYFAHVAKTLTFDTPATTPLASRSKDPLPGVNDFPVDQMVQGYQPDFVTPGLNNATEDWSFGAIDMAFFDDLMFTVQENKGPSA